MSRSPRPLLIATIFAALAFVRRRGLTTLTIDNVSPASSRAHARVADGVARVTDARSAGVDPLLGDGSTPVG
jgi:hypothetical protein